MAVRVARVSSVLPIWLGPKAHASRAGKNYRVGLMRTIEQATLHLPCEWHEYPKIVTTTVFEVHDYGRAIPRGLVVHEGEIWIVSHGGRGTEYWRLETKVSDVVAHQRGGNFSKWRNYLRRIVRWPWKDEDTQEIQCRT